MNAQCGGSRTRRNRAWVIAVNPHVAGMSEQQADKLLESVLGTLNKLLLKPSEVPFPEEWYLLEDDHAYHAQVQADKRTREESSSDWLGAFQKLLFDEQIMMRNVVLPESLSPQFGKLKRREQLCVGYSLYKKPNATSCDMSQTLGRGSIGTDDIFPTICSSSKFWHMKRKRVITGVSMMTQMTIPDCQPQQHSIIQAVTAQHNTIP